MRDYFVEEEIKTKKNKKHYVKNSQTEEIQNIIKSINILKSENIDNRRIFGYLTMNQNAEIVCKYDKKTGLFITISKDKVTHDILSWREYQGRKAYEYYDEI